MTSAQNQSPVQHLTTKLVSILLPYGIILGISAKKARPVYKDTTLLFCCQRARPPIQIGKPGCQYPCFPRFQPVTLPDHLPSLDIHSSQNLPNRHRSHSENHIHCAGMHCSAALASDPNHPGRHTGFQPSGTFRQAKKNRTKRPAFFCF